MNEPLTDPAETALAATAEAIKLREKDALTDPIRDAVLLLLDLVANDHRAPDHKRMHCSKAARELRQVREGYTAHTARPTRG